MDSWQQILSLARSLHIPDLGWAQARARLRLEGFLLSNGCQPDAIKANVAGTFREFAENVGYPDDEVQRVLKGLAHRNNVTHEGDYPHPTVVYDYVLAIKRFCDFCGDEASEPDGDGTEPQRQQIGVTIVRPSPHELREAVRGVVRAEMDEVALAVSAENARSRSLLLDEIDRRQAPTKQLAAVESATPHESGSRSRFGWFTLVMLAIAGFVVIETALGLAAQNETRKVVQPSTLRPPALSDEELRNPARSAVTGHGETNRSLGTDVVEEPLTPKEERQLGAILRKNNIGEER